MRTSRWVLALVLTAVALGATAWLVASVIELHDRLARHSGTLAVGFIGVALLVASVAALAAARVFWKLSRPPRPPAQAPEDVVRAAEVQAEKAEGVIAQVKFAVVWSAGACSRCRAARVRGMFSSTGG